MISRYLPVLLLMLTASILQAQNNNNFVTIQGPFVVCGEECDTLIATVGEDAQGVFSPPYTYTWTGPGGFTTTLPHIFLCPVFPGTYTVTVSAVNGNTASASHTVYVLPFQPLNIFSNNLAPCNGDSTTAACEKVCPNTTVTYFAQNIVLGDTFPLT